VGRSPTVTVTVGGAADGYSESKMAREDLLWIACIFLGLSGSGAGSSRRPLKEEGCDTEIVFSVDQLFRRLSESDDFLEVGAEMRIKSQLDLADDVS
jgi:hypothetical protein